MNPTDNIVKLAEQFFQHIPNQGAFIVDTRLQLRYITAPFASISNFKVGEFFDATMLSTKPINFDIEHLSEIIQDVLKDRIKRYCCMSITQQDDTQKLMDFYAGALVEPQTDEILGVIIYIIRYQFGSHQEMVMFQNREAMNAEMSYQPLNEPVTPSIISEQNPKIKLTAREENVIFLLILNYSSREIAETLSKIEQKSISKDSIDKLIANRLQQKFNIVYRYKLVEKLIQQGYHKHIPKAFLSNFVKDIVMFD